MVSFLVLVMMAICISNMKAKFSERDERFFRERGLEIPPIRVESDVEWVGVCKRESCGRDCIFGSNWCGVHGGRTGGMLISRYVKFARVLIEVGYATGYVYVSSGDDFDKMAMGVWVMERVENVLPFLVDVGEVVRNDERYYLAVEKVVDNLFGKEEFKELIDWACEYLEVYHVGWEW